jgi:DUF4097 and DUF4098 domain-containing protein YvlB
MNRKWIIASILVAVLLVLCAASLFAIWQGTRMMETSGIDISIRNNSVKAVGVEEKTLTVSGPVSLTLNNDFGDVSVTGGAEGQVKVIAEKTAWGSDDAEAQKELEELKVLIEQNGNNINISLQHPDQMHVLNLRPDIWGVKFTIIVPEETATTLDSLNGDLLLSATTGNADLQTDFGSIQVSNASGALVAKTNNGNITAKNITGGENVTLTSEFGNIIAQEISGAAVSAESKNGTLDLQGMTASGVLKAGSDFGSISLINSQAATIEVQSTNGKVTLENVDVDGKLTIHNDFGDLTLNAVDAGAYDLKTQNGKIKVDQARGSITAQSDFGDVEVLNVENGTIDLSSTNGAVKFSGSLAGGPHSASSDFGSITLTLPAETTLNVDLQTDFGKISSDFEITVSGALDDNHWVGKFNGGGEELTVKTNNGNITINSN